MPETSDERRADLNDRVRLDAPGAREVLDQFAGILGSAVGPGVAAARALADADVTWTPAREAIIDAGRSVILASTADGPLLLARAFRAGEPTTVHDHGVAGAAVVVEGQERYERFERTAAGTARLESVHHLAAGDAMWWNEPPDDVHRQEAITDISIELILVAATPAEPTVLDVVHDHPSQLRAAVVSSWLEGDVEHLRPWYAPDVLGDLNVPHWRFQVRGAGPLLALLDTEEFQQPDRRLTQLRVTDTAEGLLLETEQRFTQGGELRLFREVHHLRCRDGLVVEQTVWCSGISDATTAGVQLRTAPMERA